MAGGPSSSDLADTPSWNPQAPVAGQAPQMGNTQGIQYQGAFGQPSNNFAGGGMGKGPSQGGQPGQQQQGQYDSWGRPTGAAPQTVGHQGQGAFNDWGNPPAAAQPAAPGSMVPPAPAAPQTMGHQGMGAFNNWRDTLPQDTAVGFGYAGSLFGDENSLSWRNR